MKWFRRLRHAIGWYTPTERRINQRLDQYSAEITAVAKKDPIELAA